MPEFVFRGIKKQSISIANDTPAMKSFYTLHQDEIKREVEALLKKAND